MPKRQSKKLDPVSADRLRERAAHVGVQIRERLQQLGMVDGQGKYEIERLRHEIGRLGKSTPRWQTVQEWVLGVSVPGARYDRQLAEVLDMNLDELAGLALEQEPDSEAWRTFRESDAYRNASPAERRAVLRAVPPPDREPVIGFYEMQLQVFRTLTRPS